MPAEAETYREMYSRSVCKSLRLVRPIHSSSYPSLVYYTCPGHRRSTGTMAHFHTLGAHGLRIPAQGIDAIIAREKGHKKKGVGPFFLK